MSFTTVVKTLYILVYGFHISVQIDIWSFDDPATLMILPELFQSLCLGLDIFI